MSKNKRNIPTDPDIDGYAVEKIIDVRTNAQGIKEYFLKWVGYDDKDNSWEPEHNLECYDLIKEFENERAAQNLQDISSSSSSTSRSNLNNKVHNNQKRRVTICESLTSTTTTSSTSLSEMKSNKRKLESISDKRPHGFERGLEPEKIIGATDSSGQLMFLMKWEGTDEADLVPAKQANSKCPQVVIKFYEERLTWHSPSGEETVE